MAERKDGELLQELEALSKSLYQSHNDRRTASLVLPRSGVPDAATASTRATERSDSRPRRRMSISPWRPRPKQQDPDDGVDNDSFQPRGKSRPEPSADDAVVGGKKGIWNWKPMRALSHITMNRLSCLFSVEVIAVQGLPASMNGLRLSVFVRKKDTRDGAVQTMPARVLQGSADFEETLFVRCRLYCSGGVGTGKPVKFEPRPFLVSAVAIDAPELNFGRNTVDLCTLVKESMDRNLEGVRLRQWEKSFPLSGKARGGELVVKLGFQIMEDSGVGIYNQPDLGTRPSNSTKSSPVIARKHSKTSFSVTSPRTPARSAPDTSPGPLPSRRRQLDYDEIDDFKLDEPAPSPPPPSPPRKVELEPKAEDLEFPEFEVVEKGVEVQHEPTKVAAEESKKAGEKNERNEAPRGESASSDQVVVKEVVLDDVHQKRLTELDSIAAQIMALESMMTEDGYSEVARKGAAPGANWNVLDTEEETVTREFLQLLEMDDSEDFTFDVPDLAQRSGGGAAEEGGDARVFVPDLGRALSTVVQTKDGGYLAAANPFDVEVLRKDIPKLSLQISKPFVLKEQTSASGFEVLQRMAGMGCQELGRAVLAMAGMDELAGKTAEQIAFEGMASAIISGRNKEVQASSSAARSVAQLKEMAGALRAGRKERVGTGLWHAGEGRPVAVEGVLALVLQRLEAMAVEALRVQADMAEEEAPFDVFTLAGKGDPNPPLASAVALEEWVQRQQEDGVTVVVVVQLRDPMRRYEAVGGPMVGIVQAERVGEGEYKVGSLHVGGMRVRGGKDGGGGWDGERQRTTAAQWLVEYGLVGKGGAGGGRKGTGGVGGGGARAGQGKRGNDVLWSLSSRVVADKWLEPTRNPDVKFPRQQ